MSESTDIYAEIEAAISQLEAEIATYKELRRAAIDVQDRVDYCNRIGENTARIYRLHAELRRE